MNLLIDLLRHGETECGGGLRGSIDDALTALGWEQMHATANKLPRWDRLLSSPLQRCRLFAEALAQSSGAPLSIEADLQELHFGEWEGRSPADLMLTHERQLGQFWNDPYAYTPPGGESVAEFAARVFGALDRLQARFDGERVLLVTHGGVIRLLSAFARGLPREQLLQVVVGHGECVHLQRNTEGRLCLV
ncbi:MULTISPECIES: alpha-ribazole phosphatase family protein [Pseudomonas]|uniref:alpha-ribazole phosphatase family protein n=1 Tax=Pseudomonas TaxID=286 RepID=UPI0030031B3F